MGRTKSVKRLGAVVITDDKTTAKFQTSRGHVAYVDSRFAPEIAKHQMCEHDKGYPQWRSRSGRTRLHRHIALLAGLDVTYQIDHRDGNVRNCRVDNLRTATAPENSWNEKLRAANTSGVKGVSYNKRLGKWTASIRYRWETWREYFDTIEEAAAAVRAKRAELHGEFARHK